MSEAQRYLAAIPRDRWPRALAAILLEGMTKHPDVLLMLVTQGESQFVEVGLRTDEFGLTRKEYQHIYKRLCRAAVRLGLPTRVQ